MDKLREIISANRNGEQKGIYSVCSAHPLVIEAALLQAAHDNSQILIESTANQVNQYGGYTGMTPCKFREFVESIASNVGFPIERIILGGDHLGPTCWTALSAKEAMSKSKELIAAYVKAGFKKIHLDASMPCKDDPLVLDDEIVSERAAALCEIAELTAIAEFGKSDLLYVVGTEVPPPGGAKEEISTIDPTPRSSALKTLEAHRNAFAIKELQNAFSRVIALVVQPGVEFDNFSVISYEPAKARDLSKLVAETDNIVFEAHSTDYQPEDAYKELVRDHYAILKVGPQLTYALREAIFALSYVEENLYDVSNSSNIRQVMKTAMDENEGYWRAFYSELHGTRLEIAKTYSFSDRIRYYWPVQEVSEAVDKLITNLNSVTVPHPLISQYLPHEYADMQNEGKSFSPKAAILNHIMRVTRSYSAACNMSH